MRIFFFYSTSWSYWGTGAFSLGLFSTEEKINKKVNTKKINSVDGVMVSGLATVKDVADLFKWHFFIGLSSTNYVLFTPVVGAKANVSALEISKPSNPMTETKTIAMVRKL